MGRSIINWSGVTDNVLMIESDHPLSNKVAAAEFLRQQNLIIQNKLELKELIAQSNNAITQVNAAVNQANVAIDNIKKTPATTTQRGLTQLSTATNITDPNACALSASEKNAGIDNTLANLIARRGVHHVYNSAGSIALTKPYSDVVVVDTTGIATGTYLMIGSVHITDPDVVSFLTIGIDNARFRGTTSPRTLGYGTSQQVVAVGVVYQTQHVKLLIQVNYINPDKYCNGALEFIRLC